MANRDQVPRYLIVQDGNVDDGALVRVSQTSASQTNEEAGLAVDQPDRSSSTIVGDIRPVISGSPEAAFSGRIEVAQAGAEGNARWSWMRDSDDQDKDFRFRQKPGVVGKRPDCLVYGDTAGPWPNKPKVRPLNDGSLLLLYMEQDVEFFFQSVAAGGWTTTFKYAQLDPATDTWSNPGSTAGLGDWPTLARPFNIDNGPYWTSFDFVVYPDTGEIVAFVAGGYESFAGPVYGVAATWGSVDGGASWRMRSRLDTSSTGVDGKFLDVATELTESGRMVALAVADDGVYSYVSDDRGRSWSLQIIDDGWSGGIYQSFSGVYQGAKRQTISMRRTRSGVLFAYHVINAERIATGDYVNRFFRMSVDGVTWDEVEHSTVDFAWMSVGVVVRPDGYPWVYGAYHEQITAGVREYFDELGQVSIVTRDPAPGMTEDQISPDGTTGATHTIHPIVDPGTGGAGRANNPSTPYSQILLPDLDGFAEVSACRHRGQVVLVATTWNTNDDEYSLSVYRLDFMQPIQERFEGDSDTIGATARYLSGFSRIWDCWGDPANWGFALTRPGAGTGAVTVPNAEGGYWSTAATGTANYWSDTTLPYPSTSLTGIVRCVLRVNSGGSTTATDIAIRQVMSDGVDFAGWDLIFGVSGNDVVAKLVDDSGAGAIGATATLVDAKSEWIEVLVSMYELTGFSDVYISAYWRMYDRDNDVDWFDGYSEIASGTLVRHGSSAEVVEFGHIAGAAVGQADWKCLHQWRHDGGSSGGQKVEFSPLAQVAAGYVDEESETVRIDFDAEHVVNDSGAYNYMRPAQAVSHPAQYIEKGLRTSWRGEALAAGAIDLSTRYTFSGGSLVSNTTPQKEWRSVTDDVDVELVFDAEAAMGPGATWDLTAIAVFGRNWHTFRFEANATDSWGAPTVSLRAGIPGIGLPAIDRSTHLLDFLNGIGGTIFIVGAFSVRVTTTSGNANLGQVFRPHRFASKASGPKYYAVFLDSPSEGQHATFRIRDNTHDTLVFYTDPIAYGVSPSASRMAIFSDRVAWDMSAQKRVNFSGFWNHRFVRLLIEGTDHADADEGFTRAGTLILGRATPIGPGIEYGFGFGYSAGSTREPTPTGATFRQRDHSARRQWSLDSPPLLPANEPNAKENQDINQARQSWQRIVDLVSRVEINGELCALAFDGIAAEGGGGADGEQLLSDPLDCALVSVASGGSVDHLGYTGSTRPEVGGDTHCVPRPIAAVRQLTLTEEI